MIIDTPGSMFVVFFFCGGKGGGWGGGRTEREVFMLKQRLTHNERLHTEGFNNMLCFFCLFEKSHKF